MTYHSKKLYQYKYHNTRRLRQSVKLPEIRSTIRLKQPLILPVLTPRYQRISSKQLKIQNGNIATRAGIKGDNQDQAFSKQMFEGVLIGIADGHGPYGGTISRLIANRLPQLIQSELLNRKQISDYQFIQIIKNKILYLQRQIFTSSIDTRISGSTLCCCFIRQDKIITAQVGDSGALLITGNQKQYVYNHLTVQQSPDNQQQRQLIQQKGGRVCLSKNGKGPLRVWLANEWAPGLAMTRSLGDRIGKLAGMTAQPKIQITKLTNIDKYVVVGSDGFFKGLNNQFFQFTNWQSSPRIVSKQLLDLSSQKHDDVTVVIYKLLPK